MAEAVEQDEDLWNMLECGGRKTCALCHQFFDDICFGCPVAQTTGEILCYGTPYDNFRIWGAEPEVIEAETKFLYEVLEWVEDLATIKE